MNKAIIATIVLAVLVFVGYLLFGPQRTPVTETPTGAQPAAERPAAQDSAAGAPEVSGQTAGREVLVTYTDEGFSPNPVTINKGESVLFMNRSSRQMWPASAVHPTHTQYPTTGGCIGSTFDACRGIGNGNGWAFQFDIPGTWKYHNHLNVSDTGTVIVNE